MLALACGVVQIGCGNASKQDCADSLIVSFTGECPGSESNGTGDGGGEGGTENAGPSGSSGTSSGGKTSRGGDTSITPGEGPNDACAKLGREPDEAEPAAPSDAKPVVVYEWGQEGNEPTLDAGDWKVDNNSVWKGQSAVHAQDLKAKGSATLPFDCGGLEHSQLSFVAHLGDQSAQLELFDGEVSRGKLAVGYNWTTQVLNVTPGKHEYRFVVTNVGTTSIAVPFVIDAFTCSSTELGASTSDVISFDDGFVPVESSGWLVDNLRGVHEGEAAIHPPVLEPGDEPVMHFDCGGREHTRLSFVTHLAVEEGELEVCDGKTSRGKLGVGYNWTLQLLDVPAGKHNYTFIPRSRATKTIAEPFVMDTFTCTDNEIEAGHNGLITADGGFVPPELTGDWFVDNLRGAHEGEAAAHPPVLSGLGEATLEIDCGESTAGLSFVAHRVTEQGELELFDGDESRGVVDLGYNWTKKTYQTETGKYRLVASNPGTKQLSESFVVDTIQCDAKL